MRRRFSPFKLVLLVAVLGTVLLTVAGSSGGRQADATTPTTAAGGPPAPPRSPAMVAENQKPGTTAWRSPELDAFKNVPTEEETAPDSSEPVARNANGTKVRAAQPAVRAAAAPPLCDGSGAPDSHWTDTVLRGFTDQVSVNQGGTVKIMIGTSNASPLPITIQIYRMGWYAGTGATLVQNLPGYSAPHTAVPAIDATTGLIQAVWPVTYSAVTDATWTSGVYLVKFFGASAGQVGYATFVVRNDSAAADVLFQLPVATYEAYNNWGGKSLYDFNSYALQPGCKVSFDRPYFAWQGAGSFFDGDFNMVRFLEAQGYNVTYTTSVDILNASAFTNRKVFLSNYHDEYWSKGMRDNLIAFKTAGHSMAFFDSNDIYWQIRYENGVSAIPNRVIVCYKDDVLDPNTTDALKTVEWREPPVNLPENAILGNMLSSYFIFTQSYDWVVLNHTHWIYFGTNLNENEHIPGLVGYEYDKRFALMEPAGIVQLSNSPVKDANGVADFQQATFYQTGTAMVFSAGTNFWSWKIDDNDYHSNGSDPRVQRMTTNILGAMIAGVAPAASPTPTPTPVAAPGFSVYSDSLATGWSDGSFSATTNLAAGGQAIPVYVGSKAFSLTITTGFGGLYLVSAGVNLTSCQNLHFALQASGINEHLTVGLTDVPGHILQSIYLQSKYGGYPVPNIWKAYSIPLADLSATGKTVLGIVLQDADGPPATGTFTPYTVYVDDVGFGGAGCAPPTPCTGAGLTASPVGAQTTPGSITLTGTATGCPNPRYRFWQYSTPANLWTILQDYSATATDTFATTGYAPGAYTFAVTVRDQSSAAERDKDAYLAYTISGTAVCATAGLTINPPTQAAVGTSLTLNASSTGCGGTPQYRYWQYSGPLNAWTILVDYSAATSQPVNTTGYAPGSYTFAVTVRSQGSSAEREKDVYVGYTLNAAGAVRCTSAGLTIAPLNSANLGTTLTLTASSTGCSGTPQYRYWQYVAATGAWTILADYSAATSQPVNTTGYTAGQYTFAVTVRSQGSAAERDADVYVGYTLNPSGTVTCASAGLSITPPTQATIPATLTLNASSSGCGGTPQYRYWQYKAATNTWSMLVDYSTSTSINVPTTGYTAGAYTFAVTVRSQGSSAEREKDVYVGYTLN